MRRRAKIGARDIQVDRFEAVVCLKIVRIVVMVQSGCGTRSC